MLSWILSHDDEYVIVGACVCISASCDACMCNSRRLFACTHTHTLTHIHLYMLTYMMFILDTRRLFVCAYMPASRVCKI